MRPKAITPEEAEREQVKDFKKEFRMAVEAINTILKRGQRSVSLTEICGVKNQRRRYGTQKSKKNPKGDWFHPKKMPYTLAVLYRRAGWVAEVEGPSFMRLTFRRMTKREKENYARTEQYLFDN